MDKPGRLVIKKDNSEIDRVKKQENKKLEAEWVVAQSILGQLITNDFSYEGWEKHKDDGLLRDRISWETWKRYYTENKENVLNQLEGTQYIDFDGEIREIQEENYESEEKSLEDDYIWDEKFVIENKVFPMDIYDNTFFYGLLLPKTVDEVNKDGDVIGKKQILSPCLITSEKELIPWNMQKKEELKIKFNSIPFFIPKRWKLENTKSFLDGRSEEISPKKLIEKIKSQYIKYLAIRNDTWYSIHALWDIGTYIYQAFEAYPFLELRGIAGTGKTKSMTVSSYISFNGGQIMVNPSEATLFREKDEIRGTSYFDEAEKLWVLNKFTKQYEGDVRTELINASYTKEGKIPRQEKIGNKFITKWYSPYGPTQLGSIAGLHGATETRAITRITTKSSNEDNRGEMEPTEDRKSPIWEEIRDECYRFGLTYWKDVQNLYLNFPKDTGLKRRDLQIWKPLLSIAKFISEDLFEEIVNFARDATQRRTEDLLHKTSFDYEILEALKICIEEEDKNKIYVNDIKMAYCKKQNIQNGISDKYLNRNISSHLDNLGFKELRGRDNKGSLFEINKKIYNEIVAPICPTLAFPSTSSSLSTQSTLIRESNVAKVAMSGENGETEAIKIDKFDFSESKIKEELENE